ncbi:hypothetical protein [Ruegeria arenilitoris]|uniref:hypothetical protein n=1 Tax=Ruegeria arenilitoris TaxID=1173585 RepID=UPI001480BC0A|nr:hypothetical protein [Ruegeria arenilitoris]
MMRLTITATAIGLLGLVTAMLAALSPEIPAAILSLGFGLALVGFLGSVIGAIIAMGRAWQSSR